MLETHTTREGREMLIAMMDDDHLVNTIKVYCRQIIDVKQRMEPADPVDTFTRALYNYEPVTPEEAAVRVRSMMRKLYPYLAEAYLRDILDPLEDVRDAIGRSTQLILPEVGMLLPERV